MKLNISQAVKTAKSVITANSPALLVGTAIAGVVTTGVLAAKGGYKARGIIDDAESTLEPGEELPFSEKARLTWLCYASPVLTGAGAIASVVGVHTIHTKRAAAMAALHVITSKQLDEYQEKAEELMGAKKTQAFQDEQAQKNIDGTPFRNDEVIVLDGGSELCHDQLSERYFMGSVNHIERAVVEVNRALVNDGGASLNDFYDHVGLPPNVLGADVGWTAGSTVSVRFGNGNLTAEGKPCVSFWLAPTPKSGFLR